MGYRNNWNPCGCDPRRVVHPTRQNCVQGCTESVVDHIHPQHTTFMNHHVVKNRHFFPKTASVQNTCSNVNVNMGSQQVSPAMQSPANMHPNQNMHYGHHHPHHGNGCC